MNSAEQMLAQKMFDAYNQEGPNPWKTFDGRDVPRWEALSDQVRGKWIAAARCARFLLSPRVQVITKEE